MQGRGSKGRQRDICFKRYTCWRKATHGLRETEAKKEAKKEARGAGGGAKGVYPATVDPTTTLPNRPEKQ